MPDALTVWPAPADLADRLAALHRSITPRLPAAVPPRDVHSLKITAPGKPEILILSAASCTPHTDATLPPWSILAVLATGSNQVIGALDGPTADDAEGEAPRTLARLRVGDLIRLNIHHLHWLTAARDGGLFSALVLDHEEPPEPPAAEGGLRRILARHGF